ncbi:amino acid dehydrogenase, partial [Pseudomonas aeruginosa]
YRHHWLNHGHGALGLTLACGSGRLLAEQFVLRPPIIDTSGLLPRCALAG